jgi:hypothetical protein
MIPSLGTTLRFPPEYDSVRGFLLVGCAPNAASLKKLKQLSKRRTQTALLFSGRQSAGDPMTAEIGLGTP